MATEIKKFIDQFIKENIEILKYDETHFRIFVETEDGKGRWVTVTQEECERDYENISARYEGKATFRKKAKKVE